MCHMSDIIKNGMRIKNGWKDEKESGQEGCQEANSNIGGAELSGKIMWQQSFSSSSYVLAMGSFQNKTVDVPNTRV